MTSRPTAYMLLAALAAALVVALALARDASARAHWLVRAFQCVHFFEARGEGWAANTGNGYYGGLQMDRAFMRRWGSEYLVIFGLADRWPREVQIAVAIRAWRHLGFRPWPNTARMCGLRVG